MLRGEEFTPERMPDPIYPYQETGLGTMYCQICGEHADPMTDEVGEFGLPVGKTDPTSPAGRTTVVAHGQCGLDHGLKTA